MIKIRFDFLWAVYAVAIGLLILLGLTLPFQVADSILVISMSVLSATFATLYWFRSNWRATKQGRALMYLTWGFTSIILSSSVVHILAPPHVEYILRFFIFAAFILTEIHITYVLYQSQHEHSERVHLLEQRLTEEVERNKGIPQKILDHESPSGKPLSVPENNRSDARLDENIPDL